MDWMCCGNGSDYQRQKNLNKIKETPNVTVGMWKNSILGVAALLVSKNSIRLMNNIG